ncbi:PREDICTED: uncharacterized protein LOC109344150 isoform X1 [Lupinus angustifolius]|uniref:uncharacterized protein LOC109344150 isoform X1 n=1 Tax=Lupinus angustifolius TaxID=3871 RepID=UPI00092FB602|nr:PREDICTED: uncharacterized protein LOC109344150 isoform X1 [Lupinus angustifolius]
MIESLDSKADCNNTNVVFIDTNIHTHLALLVSLSDTVSLLKKRILVEHPLCFPKIGHIEIHAVKVKRKGCFYHLSDSVLVKSAFNGVSKDWFLSVDASALVDVSPETISGFNYSPLPPLENKQDEKEVPFVSPLVSEHTGKEIVEYSGTGVKSSGNNDTIIPLPLSIPETEDHRHANNELSSLQIERELDRTSKSTPKDDYKVHEEVPSISVASVKKRRKSKRKKDDKERDDISKEDIASVDNVLSVASKRVSRSINFKVPQVENKLDEKEKSQFASPRESENTGKVVKKSGKGVKSSSNNDTGIPLLGSFPETENHDSVNKELRSKLDRSSKGTTKGDYNVHKEDPLTPMPSVKEKWRSKRKKGGIVQDDTSKENIASADNPLSVPSKDVSSLNTFQAPQLESKQDEKEDVEIGDESMKEASTAGPAANKKHKKRKRSSTLDSTEMLEIEAASQKDAAQEPDEAHKQSKRSKDQLEYNNDKSRDDARSKKNEVTEDFSDARPPAKKKRKGKNRSEDKSLSKEKSSMVSDFNVENAPDHLLEDQQKIKNSSNEQTGEHIKDAEPPKTSVPDRRKKGKKNSSNPPQTPVVTSSRKGYEADPSSIGGGIEEEISEVGILSKDLSMNKSTINNMEIGTDACKEDIGSNIHPSNVSSLVTAQVIESKELTEDNVNIVIDHCHKSDVGQSANIGKSNGILKAKDSGRDTSLIEGTDHVDASDNENFFKQFFKATNCDPISGNTEMEENPLNQTEGEKKQQDEMKGTVISSTGKEDDLSADNAGSLDNSEQVDKHVDKRQTNKPNIKETSITKSISNHTMSSIGENRKPHTNASGENTDLEKRKEPIPISNSKLEASKKKVQNKARRASGRTARVPSSTQQKKSLLEGAIFTEVSSGTSEDERGVDNSDASTRTPSDNSLLSDFSDVDSNAGLDSQQSGLRGGRSALKDGISGTKVAIDHVLRSSRRYKKAKIIASQTESQLEFVPDSLAD